jgi:hypothetical protein
MRIVTNIEMIARTMISSIRVKEEVRLPKKQNYRGYKMSLNN